ncbi:MAG: NAD(P)-dependent oxidoreductase [Pseudomonadota bacterium]
MATVEELKSQRQACLEATAGGPPARTSNQFFGVGPITDITVDEADSRKMRFEFDRWLENTYRKLDDNGNDLGPFTSSEIGRSMHRGYPADAILLDMMREIHRYFGFQKSNKMAVGLGGGHSGFTVCAMHMMNANDASQHVYIDTPAPESEAAGTGGFFRQSWGAQLIEMQRFAENGDESRLHFAEKEGTVPSAERLVEMGIKLFIGVGHETTGATTYTYEDITNLLEWIDRDPDNHHAVIDATSMLGAMPWEQSVVEAVTAKCSMFMPFQKAIGGISGYFCWSMTPACFELTENNQKDPAWAIPRQLKIVVPKDPKKPLSGEKTASLGPVYDPAENKMLGGIINTYSTLAFAETTFGLLRTEKLVGSVQDMNARSVANRQAINDWAEKDDLLDLGVEEVERRGAAVTLIKVTDPDVTDDALNAKLIARSKQLLGYEGLTHPNGDYEPGLDVARYVNTFPGTPGDYRAWIGGMRTVDDITALLENLKYCYLRAKLVTIEEMLAEQGVTFESASGDRSERSRKDEANRAYKVLVADLVGLKFDSNGNPDHSEVKSYIQEQGGTFHESLYKDGDTLAPGIHFFYQPDLSREDELLPITKDGQYDATIVAATFLPSDSRFCEGGVRIGAGTGNMGSGSWGGGNGDGGEAPLMNTPSFNSRATAQMAMKALLKVMPNLDVEALHARTCAGNFDTGKNLCEYPTEKIEGKTIGVIGFGNIGREVACLAKAFGMQVQIYARPHHKDWIEAEGFTYATSPVEAATGADVLSPHTGLGPLNADTGKFANDSVINAEVMNAMNDGGIIINYDRGEVVNADALDAALASGKISYAGVDADLFKNAETGELSGPMVPYLALYEKHPDKMELLPHAAADTEHVSRVEGAKQAVDQILDCIRYRSVMNLKGDLPDGYTNAGAVTVNGVGKVTPNKLGSAATDTEALTAIRDAAEMLTAHWAAISSTSDADRRAELIERYGSELVRSSNTYISLIEKLGLKGPYG